MKVCIVGASGKLGQYMVQHPLDRGCEVTGVCRERSVGKLDPVVSKNTNEPKSVIPEGVFVTRKNYRSAPGSQEAIRQLTSAPGSSAERLAPSSYAASR